MLPGKFTAKTSLAKNNSDLGVQTSRKAAERSNLPNAKSLMGKKDKREQRVHLK